MNKNFIGYTLLSLTFIVPGIAFSAPAICHHSQKIELTNEQCLASAQNAMKSSKFNNLQVFKYTYSGVVFAIQGDYSAVIRCDTSVKRAVFIVAGPQCNADGGKGYRQSLVNNFRLN